MMQPSPNARAYRLLAGGKRRVDPQVEAPPPAPPQNHEVVQTLLQMQAELIRGFTALQAAMQSPQKQDPQVAHLAELARNLLARDERRELAQRDLVEQQGQLLQQLAALKQKRLELEQSLSTLQEENAQLQRGLHLEEIKRIELLATLRLAKEKVRHISNNLENNPEKNT